MNDDDYIRELNDVIEWYKDRGKVFTACHFVFSITNIVLTAFVPIVLAMSNNGRGLAALLGGLATIISGSSAIFRFRERMLGLISTKEALFHELLLYKNGINPYHGANKKKLLIANTEQIKIDSLNRWQSLHRSNRGEESLRSDNPQEKQSIATPQDSTSVIRNEQEAENRSTS